MAASHTLHSILKQNCECSVRYVRMHQSSHNKVVGAMACEHTHALVHALTAFERVLAMRKGLLCVRRRGSVAMHKRSERKKKNTFSLSRLEGPLWKAILTCREKNRKRESTETSLTCAILIRVM